MSKRAYIPINKEELPEMFEFPFGEQTFILGINHNKRFDFFTVDLYQADGTMLIAGERLIEGEPLWRDFTDLRLPADTVTPMNEANPSEPISFATLGNSVFVHIDDLPDSETGE